MLNEGTAAPWIVIQFSLGFSKLLTLSYFCQIDDCIEHKHVCSIFRILLSSIVRRVSCHGEQLFYNVVIHC